MAEKKVQKSEKGKPETGKEAVKTEKKEAVRPVPTVKSEMAKTAEKPAAKTAAKSAVKEAKTNPDAVYHISKRREDRKWQVKAEGAAKALKLFFTQEEAIDYAKSVAGNQEGRIVIHKEDGSFRKLTY